MHLLRAGKFQRSHIQVILLHWPRLVNTPLALLACTSASARLQEVLWTLQTAVNMQDDVIMGIGRGQGPLWRSLSHTSRGPGGVCVGQVQH